MSLDFNAFKMIKPIINEAEANKESIDVRGMSVIAKSKMFKQMIFDTVSKSPGLSRAEIAELSNIKLKAVESITKRLNENGSLVGDGKRLGANGRRVLTFRAGDKLILD